MNFHCIRIQLSLRSLYVYNNLVGLHHHVLHVSYVQILQVPTLCYVFMQIRVIVKITVGSGKDGVVK